MHVPIDKVERIVISHWHADHTGGLLSFLNLRNGSPNLAQDACVIDTHPKRPFARGIAPGPLYDKVIARLPPDPTFEQIEAAGGIVKKDAEGHLAVGDMVWVSGEIPRVTSFETGLPGGKCFEPGTGWVDEPVSMYELIHAAVVEPDIGNYGRTVHGHRRGREGFGPLQRVSVLHIFQSKYSSRAIAVLMQVL